MDGDNDILELPLSDEEEQRRQDCIAYLTDFLIQAEEGKLVSVAIFAEKRDGGIRQAWTSALNRANVASRIMVFALERLGLVDQEDLSEYLRRDEE